jgi:hypothetical protein
MVLLQLGVAAGFFLGVIFMIMLFGFEEKKDSQNRQRNLPGENKP